MKKLFVRITVVSTTFVLLGLWLVYFFEDLPVELEVEKWEKLHPGQVAYSQTGFMHTAVNNLSCALHGTECDFVDAGWFYRRFILHK